MMNFKISLVVVLIFLSELGLVARARQSNTKPEVGLPVLPRIADADPSVVHEVEARIPTALKVTRTPDVLSFALDRISMQTVKLMVGKNMVTGVRGEFRVYPEGATSPLRPGIWLGEGLSFNSGTTFLNANRDGIPSPGKKYIIEVDLAIFETDIPAQHFWDPTGPNYKILWQGVVTQKVD